MFIKIGADFSVQKSFINDWREDVTENILDHEKNREWFEKNDVIKIMYKESKQIKMDDEIFFKYYDPKQYSFFVKCGFPESDQSERFDDFVSLYFEPNKIIPIGTQIKYLDNVIQYLNHHDYFAH